MFTNEFILFFMVQISFFLSQKYEFNMYEGFLWKNDCHFPILFFLKSNLLDFCNKFYNG
jgi:hypothetical protein